MDKAAGFGVLFNTGSTSGQIDYVDYGVDYYGNSGKTSRTADWTMKRAGYGGFAFFGLGQNWELNLGFLYKNPTSLKLTMDKESETLTGSDLALEAAGALQFGLYWKYPIVVSETLVFFPTLGTDFELSLSTDNYEGWVWWDDIWVRAGIGMDFFFSESTFLRTHLIYGAAFPVGGDSDLGLTFGHGLLLKAGIGFMF